MTDFPLRPLDQALLQSYLTYSVRSAAYSDISVIHQLVPLISQKSREFHRTRTNEMLLETYAMTKARKDTKTMERTAATYSKVNRCGLDDEVAIMTSLPALWTAVLTATLTASPQSASEWTITPTQSASATSEAAPLTAKPPRTHAPPSNALPCASSSTTSSPNSPALPSTAITNLPERPAPHSSYATSDPRSPFPPHSPSPLCLPAASPRRPPLILPSLG